MYGATEANASGAVLATTGLATGAYALAIIGGILVVIGVIALLRKNGKNKP